MAHEAEKNKNQKICGDQRKKIGKKHFSYVLQSSYVHKVNQNVEKICQIRDGHWSLGRLLQKTALKFPQ
jgi:hypothetical protein